MPDFNHNPELLSELIFGLEMSQGDFRLFLARSNTLTQRTLLIEKLQSCFSGELAQLQLDESVEELYMTISQQLGEKQPDAFMVWGLESIIDIDKLLVSMSLVLDEFRKNFHFPILLWIDAEVSQKFIRLIPDFENRASLTVFETPTQELIDYIQEMGESVYQKVLESGAGIFLDYADLGLVESTYQELVNTRQELVNRGINLEIELEASLEFLLGRAADNSTEIALKHYQRSRELWQEVNNPLRVAHTNYYLGLWWRSYAVRHRTEKYQAYQKACSYFQQLIEGFEKVNRPDLVAKFINAWGVALQTLKRWDKLEIVANRAIELLNSPQDRSVGSVGSVGGVGSVGSVGSVGGKSVLINIASRLSTFPSSPSSHTSPRGDYQTSFRVARAYGFLAELKLAKSHYKSAKKIAKTAIEIFHKTLNTAYHPTSEKEKITLDWEQYHHLGRYLFSLAKAEKYLGKTKSAIAIFEQAKDTTKPEYNAEFYIDILTELREIYYQQKEYLKAFEIKQEKLKTEQQFGFQAFVGANRLRDIKLNTNPSLPQSKSRIYRQKLTQEIAESGRQLDVEKLVERISRPDHKLIVIHGQSGVGKSSILQAGLVPSLEGKSIATRDVLVVLQRVYVNWISELGKILAQQLQIIANLTVNSENLNNSEQIFAQLRNNDKLNLLTVIIFDQFEEFFFENSEPEDRKEFAQFLQECLQIPSLKIVLSLRSDYIHYLLDFNRLGNLEAINNNILDKSILYYLGNFSQSQAKAVLQNLTANSQFQIDENLTEKLVEDLAQELEEIRPIELQVVGAQLQAKNITTLAKYQELGDNSKAVLVDQYLELVVKDCGAENEKLAWLMLWLLTDENNTRPLKTKAELLKEGEFNPEQLELVLSIFVGSGLVFLLPEKPADHYQLVHDYLVWFIRQRKGSEISEELKQAQAKQLHAEAKRLQLQKRLVIVSVAATLVMTLLAGEMAMFARDKQKQSIISQANEAMALSVSGERWDALMAAIEARQKQVDSKFEPIGKASNITNALRVAVYKHKQEEFKAFNSIQGHESAVSSVAFSPDGETIASSSFDKTVKLWNRQGNLLHTLNSHQSLVISVAFSPDGETIASTSDDKTVKLWNRQGKLLQTFNGHESSVNGVAFSPDGETIATASFDKTVNLWNRQGKLLQTLKGHKSVVYGVAFSPDGKTIASTSADQTIKLWNPQGKLLQTLKGHESVVFGIAFSPDGETIASASDDQTIKLWNRQGKLLQTLKGHESVVIRTAFSLDGETIASASGDQTVKLWNRQGKLLQTLKGHKNWVNGVAFSPDGETIATASRDQTVKLWNRQESLLQTLKGHESSVNGVAFSPDGEIIASASADKTVKLWNLQGNLLQTLKGYKNWVNGAAVSPDGETIKTVKLWNPQGNLLRAFKDHKSSVNGVAFSPDGETIASASGGKTVKLWNRQGNLLRAFKGHEDQVYGVAFSPDGETIASGSADKTVKLWNLQGNLLQTLKGHNNWVYGVAFSSDGETIASGSADKTVKLWNLQGNLLQTLKGHESWVNSVAFSPDGETIASVSDDKTIKLWNKEGNLLQTLNGHESLVNDVAFSSDGETIASASADKTIKLWNLQGDLLQTLNGHESSVNIVAFSPDGETIVFASDDKTVKLWRNWQIEDLTKSGCRWLNDYLITHPQKLEELRICQTYERKKLASRNLVIAGEKLAREGKVKEAVNKFKKALKWNPEIKLKPKVRAELLVEAEKLMEEGTKLAREGKIEAAMEKYQRAKEIDKKAFMPFWQNIDLEAKAKSEAGEVGDE